MKPVIHWFRQDLRLSDHPVLRASCASALAQGAPWLAVFVWDPAQTHATQWVGQRMGPHRVLALQQALSNLSKDLRSRGHSLRVLQGEPTQAIMQLVAGVGAGEVWSEQLPAPEEAAVDQALAQASLRDGWRWQTRYQGGLFELGELPFHLGETPDVFTAFRQAVQRSGLQAAAPQAHLVEWPQPLSAPAMGSPCPPWPQALSDAPSQVPADPRSSFPLTEPAWHIGEQAAQSHWARYLAQGRAHHYKATRDGLQGTAFSTKLSPWLAWGAISARQAQHALQTWETAHGASDSSGWITFELLWREHFRLLHFKHGRQLYRARGLSRLSEPPQHDPAAFERWCQGDTGHALVDAAMRELKATGWLSNRLRQVVASYLIHQLRCDWRAGAAWFESRLIDFDVFSNQGNWAYIAGRGTDPRGGRRFDADKQAREHDPDGSYRRMWSQA